MLAEIGAAHGIRGEVRVKSHTADPLAFGRYGPLFGSDGRTYEVAAMRVAGKFVVTRFRGVEDRSAAERIRGVKLSVPRSALPDDMLEEGEYYHADMIGLSVADVAGKDYGHVVAVHDFGAGDVIEILGPRGDTAMVPFSRAAVPVVDIAGGRMVVDPVAAGLSGGEEADDDAL